VILHEAKAQFLIDQLTDLAFSGSVHAATMLESELDSELENLRKANIPLNPYKSSQEKEMEVCDVCGSLLVINEDAKRLETHYEGRQHSGYLKIREELKRLEVSILVYIYVYIPTCFIG
jgi:DNA repair exonuclease SbcCD ATPase subunit